jgi:hypothetical protein
VSTTTTTLPPAETPVFHASDRGSQVVLLHGYEAGLAKIEITERTATIDAAGRKWGTWSSRICLVPAVDLFSTPEAADAEIRRRKGK